MDAWVEEALVSRCCLPLLAALLHVPKLQALHQKQAGSLLPGQTPDHIQASTLCYPGGPFTNKAYEQCTLHEDVVLHGCSVQCICISPSVFPSSRKEDFHFERGLPLLDTFTSALAHEEESTKLDIGNKIP